MTKTSLRGWIAGIGIAAIVAFGLVCDSRCIAAPRVAARLHATAKAEDPGAWRWLSRGRRGSELIGALTLLQLACGFALILALQARRKLERSLLDTETQLSLAALSANVGVWRWDATSEKLWASETCRSILGLPQRVPILVSALRARVHPTDLIGFDSLFAATYHSFSCEFRVQATSGEMRWISCNMRSTWGSSERLASTIGAIQDVTERKHSEAELRQQRMQLTHLTRLAILGQFSGALAHEITQPLTSILSNAQAAQRVLSTKKSDLEEVREILSDIVSDDLRAGEVIQRLKELLKRGEANIHALDVSQLVSEVLSVARSALTERRIEVRVRIEPGLPIVRGDRVQIQQILLNLLLNASDAMATTRAPDRRIEIAAARAADLVRISVSDQGTGIEAEQLDGIFDAFYTTKSNGLGLGLAICRSIVTAHGGRLWATNNPGRGATLHFTLRESVPLPRDYARASGQLATCDR
jgi:C4-dicarboxylate-specific signal transduction histidine kinase